MGVRVKLLCRARLIVTILLVSLVASACAPPVRVQRAAAREVHRSLTASVLSSGELSGATQIALRRYDLVERFEDDPAAALADLHVRVLAGSAGGEGLAALAELSFYHAEEVKSRAHYLAAAVYAFTYLLPEEPGFEPPLLDPRNRLMCDLYNRALTRAFASDDGYVALAAGTLPLPFGSLEVSFDRTDLNWGARRLVRFVPVAELDVIGLQNRYRRAGIGAPLAASTEPRHGEAPDDDFVDASVQVPATALLLLERPRQQLRQRHMRAHLELFAASETEEIELAGRRVPLEVEPSASLASTLAESRPWEQELDRFLGLTLALEKPARLTALQPYRRGSIPVVFVHGTASSPSRWADMLNDLESDPEIRRRFQFWFFSYDSGNPITYSSMLLRRALQEALAELDPAGTDDCLRQMVVIGHSQGGLLTKMTAIDSGSRFWDDFSGRPIEELELSPETRTLLQEGMFVKPLPFVRRVVFVATPHRGSYLAGPQLIRRLAARLVGLPSTLLRSSAELVRLSEDPAMKLEFERLPTSIDNMSPGHAFIRSLAQIPIAPGVAAHSIIPIDSDTAFETAGDGVVKYASAHLDGVESELIIDSPHSCQAHPDAVNEVERILRQHAAASACGAAPR